ncbi:sigma-70 family RNA polymerase sigma factor [Singulisphaera sp. Ch08]|uniref:Sigma-70 family RNA polymerase sigma factor n=1 Tax=Singulisphaera sp. Ch08 TaxID=3120278 RepID=A0AAU7CHE3_9BACT
MAKVRSGSAVGQLQSLFQVGTISNLTDGQLLERFHSRRGAMAEAAFEALVERHGAMVLGVCRRILADPHDADDAFQATFLILVQRAGSIRVDDSLGRWLYGVSSRVAIRAKAQAARRRRLEERVAAKPTASTTNDLVRLDLRSVLDEELRRLPEKYRAPVVLCHLQGLSQDETARVLGWPLGTVQGRLARARETLRNRLSRRGLTPSTSFSITGLFALSHPGPVPFALRRRTVQAVMRMVGGEATLAGTGSAAAIALAKGAGGTMLVTKLKFASLLVLFAGIGAGTTVLPQRATAEQRTSAVPNPPPRAEEPALVRLEPGTRPPAGTFRIPMRLVPGFDSLELGTRPTAGTFRIPMRLVPGFDSKEIADDDQVVLISIGAQEITIPRESNAFVRAIRDTCHRATEWLWVDAPAVERKPSDQSSEVEATTLEFAPGAEEAKSTRPLTVIEPKLAVTLIGPKQRFPKTIATYSLTVENSGTAPAQNVQVEAILPGLGPLVKLPPGSKFDPQSRRLTWPSLKIEPGKTSLKFEVRLGDPGLYKVTAKAVDQAGLNVSDTTFTEVIGLADLDLGITEDRRVIDVNQLTTFTVRVRNKGSNDARNVIISVKNSANVTVTKTAGTEEPARFKRNNSGKPIEGEIHFPPIPRLKPGQENVLGIQVKALEPGTATCRVFLSHDDADQPLEAMATLRVTQP